MAGLGHPGHAGRYQGRVYRVRTGAREITGTPHHLASARPTLDAGQHVVYLMNANTGGFRIGETMSVRSRRVGEPDLGPRVRINQEHGDRLRILGVVSWSAAQYGLPTDVHHAGRRLVMGQDALDGLFDAIDTRSRAAKDLLEDLDLHLDFPHLVPQNGLRSSVRR